MKGCLCALTVDLFLKLSAQSIKTNSIMKVRLCAVD